MDKTREMVERRQAAMQQLATKRSNDFVTIM